MLSYYRYFTEISNLKMTIKIANNPRFRAIEIILAVTGHTRTYQSLQESFTSDDTPFVYQLVYGTLRFYHALSTMVNHALKQPLSGKDQDIYVLLLVGIYQIQHLDIAQYAIVKETVDVVDILKKSWAKKLVNAILRRFLREREAFEAICDSTEVGCYAHPQWFIDRLKIAWPEQWKEILNANNQKAPMHLRVNALKTTRDAYLDILNKVDITAHPLNVSVDGICLEQAVDVKKLPHFSAGWVSVQDGASQAVVDYLDLQPNQRILDACAAPGGKTGHILERMSALSALVALDVSAERMQKIAENLERLGLNAVLLTGDAALPEMWWKHNVDKVFDRILIDAPCSATGVIRRHPDIKLLRKPKDIIHAVQKQREILDALWPLLAEAGRLVYTTCSVLPEENQAQIAHFLQTHPDAQLDSMKQILPNNLDNIDGFFYAAINKV